MPNLLIAASGTGGHLFPALAVAEALPVSWNVRWLGVPDRLEMKLVPKRYCLTTIQVGGLQARGLKNCVQLCQLIASSLKVRRFLQKQKIQVVFTTGGYISAPTIIGAVSCGIPVILHESNAIPGRVTSFLGRYCSIVALGLSITAQRLSAKRILVTGTPVRSAFFVSHPLPQWVPTGSGPLIVVMGGSQGAVGLNQMVHSVLPLLLQKGCRVVHLTGSHDRDAPKHIHPSFVEKPFSDEIPGLLQHADLAISRSGAGALSELAVSNTPAILVPYPQSKDNHQDANASYAAELGAAVIVHQHPPEGKALQEVLFRLLRNRLSDKETSFDPLIEMQFGMERMARRVRGAEGKLVDLIQGFI